MGYLQSIKKKLTRHPIEPLQLHKCNSSYTNVTPFLLPTSPTISHTYVYRCPVPRYICVTLLFESTKICTFWHFRYNNLYLQFFPTISLTYVIPPSIDSTFEPLQIQKIVLPPLLVRQFDVLLTSPKLLKLHSFKIIPRKLDKWHAMCNNIRTNSIFLVL